MGSHNIRYPSFEHWTLYDNIYVIIYLVQWFWMTLGSSTALRQFHYQRTPVADVVHRCCRARNIIQISKVSFMIFVYLYYSSSITSVIFGFMFWFDCIITDRPSAAGRGVLSTSEIRNDSVQPIKSNGYDKSIRYRQ